MTDADFEKLAARRPPAPDADARARALSAAMQAFDADEENLHSPQGSTAGGRRSAMFNRIWSPVMNRRFLAGSALATLLVVPAAGLLTYELMRSGPLSPSTPAPADTIAGAPAAETMASAPPVAEGWRMSTLPARQDGVAALGGAVPQAHHAARNALSLTREAPEMARPLPQREDRERFTAADLNPVKSVASDPVSTFSADVDTASYSYVRRSLLAGSLPDRDAVRVEEMVNYFPYDWKGPDTAETPFHAAVTVMPTPWNKDTELLHIGIKGFEAAPDGQPAANLVFLIDVSGSMDQPDKLPLLKSAFRLLVGKLKDTDTVSIVTYAGEAGTVLEPTAAKDRAAILAAIDGLRPGGSTAGAGGIEAAYALAAKAFRKDGVNRVMLATDGDFNIGPSSDEDLKALIEAKRRQGIFLSVLGFGRGNYNDGAMQALAQNGNGTAAYIDTLAEAEKTLVEEAGSMLFPIASDVKLQIEFNPARIAEYRLIGYETRALNREDFNDDRVDAGDIGSGHRVTAIYEITPRGSPAVLNDPLRYADKAEKEAAPGDRSELAFLKLRWKKPDAERSELSTLPVTDADVVADPDSVPQDVRFSVAVAAFGQKLKGVPALQDYAYGSILGLAEAARGNDPFGYRAEFLTLTRLAAGLAEEAAQ